MENELQKLRIDKSRKARSGRNDGGARWPWVLLVLLLIGGGVAGWQYYASQGVEVEAMRVRLPEGAVRDDQLVSLTAVGYVIAAHKIELASKVVGRVAWVGVEMGDRIEKGQPLVRLEDDEYKARLAPEQGQLDAARAQLAELEAGSRAEEIAMALAELNVARAELDTATRSLRRLTEMTGMQAVSRQELDDAETLLAARTAAVEVKQQKLDLAKAGTRKEQIDAQRAIITQLEGGVALAMVELTNTVIRSPIQGRVLERNVEVGEFVTTGFVGDRGAKGYVVSIADLNDLRVDLDISQKDFARIRDDLPCWITTDAYPDVRFNGKVHLISPEANRQKATVQVRVKVLDPDERLKPDMNATVSFLNPSANAGATTKPAGERPVLRIPASSVRNGAVLVVEDGRAIERVVSTGTTVDGKIEIRSGLIGGELLVLSPPAILKDGDPVRLNANSQGLNP